MSETDAASEAVRSDEVDRLRRVAFGRTLTPAEETAAEAALGELARIDAEIDAAREAARQADAQREAERQAADAEAALADAHEHPPEQPLDHEPARWRRWLAPATVGIVAGALVAAGIAFAYPSDSAKEPSAVATSDAVTDNGASTNVNYFLGDAPETTSSDGTMAGITSAGGDVVAAARWFDDEQTKEDLEGVGSLLPEFDRASVRLVHASSIARAWVANRTDGQLCLEVTVTETDYTSGSCAFPRDFADRGLTVSTDTITVRWNGSQINVLMTSSTPTQ